MVCQFLSAAPLRRCRYLLGVLLAASLVVASSAFADDFRILIVRDGAIDRTTGLTSGELFINAGYINGIDTGMTGVVWRKNKYKGQLEVADIAVIEVSPYDAVCRYTLRHPDFYVLKKDKAALTPTIRQDADILAKGIDAHNDRLCFEALMYFERIFCPTQDNAFVQSQIGQCLAQVQQRLTGGLSDEEKRSLRGRIGDDCELAECHHMAKNDLAADMYLKRILAVDTGVVKAAALRDSVPEQDYTSLFSPARCK